MKRVLTALLLIPLFCYIVLWSPYVVFLGAVVAVSVLLFREFANLTALHNIAKPGVFGYVAGLVVLFEPARDMTFLVLVAILAMALALRSTDLADSLPSAGALLLGVAYVFGSMRCCIELHEINHYWLLFALS